MCFITFLPFLKMRRIEKFKFNSTRLSNSSLFQKDAGQNVGIALVGLLHYMGVNIGRGADLGVSQPFGNTHTVHPIEVQHRGHCMPESMRVKLGYFHKQSEFGLHMPAVFGDHVEDVKMLGRVLGMEVVVA